jgi:hypothetical protein
MSEIFCFESKNSQGQAYISDFKEGEAARELVEEYCFKKDGTLHYFYDRVSAMEKYQELKQIICSKKAI